MATAISSNSADRLAARPAVVAVEDATDGGLEPFADITLELTPSRSEAGATVQMSHSRRIPGRVGAGPIRLPGGAGVIKERFLTLTHAHD